MKLRTGERCPIHRRMDCCGRKTRVQQRWRPNPVARDFANERSKRTAERRRSFERVRRIEDAHHPRGYREICSAAELRRRLLLKLEAQNGFCAICNEEIEDVREAAADHIEPRGMGGGRRDDSLDNLQATHARCNFAKGSKRNFRLTPSGAES